MRPSIRAFGRCASAGSRMNGTSCTAFAVRRSPSSICISLPTTVARPAAGYISDCIGKHVHAPGPQPCINEMRYFGTRANDRETRQQHDAATRTNRKNHRRRQNHHRPRPTPRPVTTAEHSRMQSLTTSLLCLDTNPPGSFTPPLTRTVHETVFWNLHLKSYGGTAAADELIRRLVLERTDGWNGGCIVAGRAVEAVMDSWRILSSPSSKRSSMEAIPAEERADSLLQYLRHSSMADGANDPSLAPSSKSYNMVIDAHARAGRPDDARTVYECHPQRDVVSFNGLLKACSVAVAQDANSDRGRRWADEAERLLQEREDMVDANDEQQNGPFGPNAVSYGTVIGALAKLASEDGAVRAENILRRMVERCYAENDDVDSDVPSANVIIFAQVLSAWAKSGSIHAGHRAEKILRWMEDANVSANAVCYNSAIDAWSRSPDEDAAERAEMLLREMEHQRDLRHSKDKHHRAQNKKENSLNPTTVTYTSVITAWSRSNRFDAAERAETVLSDMIYAHDRMRDASIRPNQLTYGAILAAWAASSHPKAVDRAEDILNGLLDRYNRGEGGEECRPNEVMFNSVLHALSNSSRNDAVDRARELLGRMWRLYDECGHWDVRPTTTSYNCLLNCLAKSKRGVSAREALELLGQMERDSSIPAPDIYSYVSVIDALAAEGTDDAARKAHAVVDRVETLHHRSSDPKLRPNILLYTALVRAIDASGEVESAPIQSVEDRVRRAGIRIDSFFSRAVEKALENSRARA